MPPTPTQPSTLRHLPPDPSSGGGGGGGHSASNDFGAYNRTTPLLSGDLRTSLGSDFIAARKVIKSLSEREKQLILEVLNRDDDLRQRETARLR